MLNFDAIQQNAERNKFAAALCEVSLVWSRCSALGAAALDNRVYVCGGYDGVASLSSVECYDPETDV